MSGPTYYDGPQLTGEAIDANVFCHINPTPNPDTVVMADNGTTASICFVSSVALDSGQPLYGMQDSGYAIIKCEAGYTPVAGAELTSGTDGEAAAAEPPTTFTRSQLSRHPVRVVTSAQSWSIPRSLRPPNKGQE